jgi:nitrate reductase gamma subunit
MLLTGLLIVLFRISTDRDTREVTFGADYLFIGLLLVATVTGFLTEFASEFNSVEWIFLVYVTHLFFRGVHHCDLCGTCQDVCPQHIKIVPLMRLLKSRSAPRGLSDKYALPTKALHEMSEGLL